MNKQQREALLDPLFDDNPISLQVLGICSALAVKKSEGLVAIESVSSGAR